MTISRDQVLPLYSVPDRQLSSATLLQEIPMIISQRRIPAHLSEVKWEFELVWGRLDLLERLLKWHETQFDEWLLCVDLRRWDILQWSLVLHCSVAIGWSVNWEAVTSNNPEDLSLHFPQLASVDFTRVRFIIRTMCSVPSEYSSSESPKATTLSKIRQARS
jgi:hypothetical protein